MLRTNYLIDAYQKTYFVLDDIEQLFDSVLDADFEFLFQQADQPAYEPDARLPTDQPRPHRLLSCLTRLAPRTFAGKLPRSHVERPRSKTIFSVTLRRIDLDRGERAVLRDVNWRIRPGQRWLLVGGNGAGKTQLLKLLAGSVWPKPTARELRRYRWQGEAFDTPAGVAEEIAYVGAERQDRYEHYEWNFRVRDVVGTGVQRTDIPMRELDPVEQRRVATLLKRLGVGGLAERRFLTLSYGERRLVLIARALGQPTETAAA